MAPHYAEYELRSGVLRKEEGGKRERTMKIGDKVRIKKEAIPLDFRGSEGIITDIEKQYWVHIKDVLGDRWFFEDELELIK